MSAYLEINGKRVELTKKQLKELGIPNSTKEMSPMTGLIEDLRDNGCRAYEAGEVFEDFGMKFKIIGFNHDKGEDGKDQNTGTLMILDPVPKHRMNLGACPRGWIDSELRKWANGEYFDSLPAELKSLIVPTVRETNAHDGKKYSTVDRLFLPTESELFGSAILSACMCGERYEAFSTSKDRILLNDDGSPCCYWTSSALAGNTTNFVNVNYSGNMSNDSASTDLRAPLCFRIA